MRVFSTRSTNCSGQSISILQTILASPVPVARGRLAAVQKYDVTLILFTLHYSALHVIALWAFKVAYLYNWKSTVFFTGLISILTYQILNNNNLNSLSHLYFPQCSDIRQYQPGSCKYQPLLKKWHTLPASPDFCAENCSYKSGTRCSPYDQILLTYYFICFAIGPATAANKPCRCLDEWTLFMFTPVQISTIKIEQFDGQ